MRILSATAAIALSGCATVELDASQFVCTPSGVSETSKQLLPEIDQLTLTRKALSPPQNRGFATAADKSDSRGMEKPGTSRLDKISPTDIAAGRVFLNRLQDASKGKAGKSTRDAVPVLLPWLSEVSSSNSPLIGRDTEANEARKQLQNMWESTPGVSSKFRANLVKGANDNDPFHRVKLGTFSKADASFAKEVQRTLVAGGYDALALGAAGQLSAINNQFNRFDGLPVEVQAQVDQLLQEFNTARFITVYFRAYFRGGRLFEATLNAKDLADKYGEQLNESLQLDSAKKDVLKQKLREALEKACMSAEKSDVCLLTRPLGEKSFVTRSGQSVQFGGVTAAFGAQGTLQANLLYPKSEEVAPQLMRVMFEAIYDSHGLVVPAISSSTACESPPLYPKQYCLGPDNMSVQAVAHYSDGGRPTTAERVKWVDEYANRVEATVTALTSQLIRGGGWVSLNNEAVAKTVETIAGVNSRKVAEKALWKIQSDCEAGVDPGALALSIR